jgi:hypothetical protein
MVVPQEEGRKEIVRIVVPQEEGRKESTHSK